jgi:hypothetical protein
MEDIMSGDTKKTKKSGGKIPDELAKGQPVEKPDTQGGSGGADSQSTGDNGDNGNNGNNGNNDQPVRVSLTPTYTPPTDDQSLWAVIRSSTDALSFEQYDQFITPLMCGEEIEGNNPENLRKTTMVPFPRVGDYNLLKVATEHFLKHHCGVAGYPLDQIPLAETDDTAVLKDQDLRARWDNYLKTIGEKNGEQIKTLPYLALIRRKLPEVPVSPVSAPVYNAKSSALDEVVDCYYKILGEKLTKPCFLELIWSYWHEEGMLEQIMNAISLRFQNKRRGAGKDPLEHLYIDPLRPLNNLFWGYIQDEQHRLHLQRRAYEYNHEYGLILYGKAVPSLQPVDSRSKFIEAFHNLLHQCAIFFVAEDDSMVIADGFPILNALQEVHLLLAQGAHNQYGDLPWTARMEMLMQQWLLARPEMREFLGRRIMMPYPEAWMDRVDTVKQLHGWTDVSIINFNVLAKCGEQILLSIRFGNWSKVIDRDNAANWARFWRAEIQGYIHNYRVVTGVDLTTEPVDTTLPSVHLRRRLAERLKELPRGRQVRKLSAARQRRQSPGIHAPVHAELFE